MGFSLQDWEDITPVAKVVNEDTPSDTWSAVVAGPDSQDDSSAQALNTLPGLLRVGSTVNHILFDPSEPLIKLDEDGVDRLIIGKVDTGVYGIKINDASGDMLVQIDTNQAKLCGWDLAQHTLTASSGVVGLGSEVTAGIDWRFWAGHATPGSAPFRVDEDGNLYTTSAYITGSVTVGGTISSTNWAASAGMQIDLDNATFTVREADGLIIDSTGGIKVNDGGDITLVGDGSNPGSVIFNSDDQSVNFGMNATDDIMSILPDAKGKVSLNIGNTTEWSGVTDPNFKSIDMVCGPDGTTHGYLRFEYNNSVTNLLQHFVYIDEGSISLESSYASTSFPYSNKFKVDQNGCYFIFVDSLSNVTSEIASFERNSLFNYEINFNVPVNVSALTTFSVSSASNTTPVDRIELINTLSSPTGFYASPSIIFKNSEPTYSGYQAKIFGSKDRFYVRSSDDSWSTNTDMAVFEVDKSTFSGEVRSEAGVLRIKEITTPTAVTGYGKLYTKTDNKVYFQTGDNIEHEIAFV